MNRSHKRFPILLWGDLVEGRRPVLRRALAGFRAHECMYAWVYLTDFLALRRLFELLPKMRPEDRRNFFRDLDGDLWERIDRSVVDPHYQVTKSGFEAVAYLACLAAQSGERQPTFVELGSTFFASKTKFEIVDQVARVCFADWPELQPKWIGIDNSQFMHDTTRVFHGRDAVELFDDYRTLAKPTGFAVFLSRFVASYVFPNSAEFADYLADRFDAVLVEDAFSTTESDIPVFNHGQAEMFFSIPQTMTRLEQAGFEIHVLDTYPEFPADSAPCHVIRFLAVRKGRLSARAKAYLAGLGLSDPGMPASATTLLQKLNASVTPQQWRAVMKAKRQSPVWGRTPDTHESTKWNWRLRAGKDLIKQYCKSRGWHRYRLGGQMALQEIHRALKKEKP